MYIQLAGISFTVIGNDTLDGSAPHYDTSTALSPDRDGTHFATAHG
jgi:hypothetical protein